MCGENEVRLCLKETGFVIAPVFQDVRNCFVVSNTEILAVYPFKDSD